MTVHNKIIANTLGDIGRLLYGMAWYEPMAKALGVDENTVRLWHTGHSGIPFERIGDLMKLVLIAGEAAAVRLPPADLTMAWERLWRAMKYAAFAEGFVLGQLGPQRFSKALQSIGFTFGEAQREIEYYSSVASSHAHG